jgi:NOL1/NOP2/sun family putative RNA methylase
VSRPLLSEDLLRLLRELPDMDEELYLESMMRPLPETFRVNTLKFPEETVIGFLKERGWEVERLPWARHGYRAIRCEREDPGATLPHLLGLIYIQGPISMVPVEALDPRPGEKVLDMCAAPGSKSTQIAQLMENEGVLVANDASSERIKPLISNLQRWGVLNCVVTLKDGRYFGKRMRETFDRTLCDVPCSSLGIVMKDWAAARNYSAGITERIRSLQLSLLLSAYDATVQGGSIVYSTCTVHPLENEWVVTKLLRRREGARVLRFELEGLRSRKPFEEWKGMKFDTEVTKCFKCYPYDNGAEGFFVALIQKGEGG